LGLPKALSSLNTFSATAHCPDLPQAAISALYATVSRVTPEAFACSNACDGPEEASICFIFQSGLTLSLLHYRSTNI
jgi:hypothetical protein